MLTDSPLKKNLHKPDVSGCLLRWSIEISGFDISFEARRAIKAQALADFIAEMVFQQKDPKPLHISVRKGLEEQDLQKIRSLGPYSSTELRIRKGVEQASV